MLEHPFEPVADGNCTVLVLGSFPSVKSREIGFYYGHPRNRFWPMLARVYGEELPADFVCPLCKHPASDFEKIS